MQALSWFPRLVTWTVLSQGRCYAFLSLLMMNESLRYKEKTKTASTTYKLFALILAYFSIKRSPSLIKAQQFLIKAKTLVFFVGHYKFYTTPSGHHSYIRFRSKYIFLYYVNFTKLLLTFKADIYSTYLWF